MNKEQLKSLVSAARGGIPVCRPARLKSIPHAPRAELAYCPFPEAEPDVLLREFSTAPQFQKIDAHEVLRRSRHGVRAILVSDSDYSARQAAVYLAALSSHVEREKPVSRDEFEIDESALDELFGIDDTERELKGAVLVTSATLLDPRIAAGGEDDGPVVTMMQEQKRLDTSSLTSPALLIHADAGPVLSAAVVEQLERACNAGRDVFIALRKSQIDLELVNELMFRNGFVVLNVLPVTDEYLENVLRAAVREQRFPLAADVNCHAVVSRLRAAHGRDFNELDLYDLAAYAAQNATGNALTDADLTYHPYRPRAGKSAMDELGAMTGLERIKETLRRQIAVFRLKMRQDTETACRSLAFAGSPGTGKSVTARLVAEILREEGCGTGRFVEAGREQLIGKYVGHTSPKIAKLFEQAKGGVLFIDEAGALIPDRSDSYAEEAVNALVRHMELAPETMVIFATYSQEMQELLDANPGLSSRIAQVLKFSDYNDEQLWEILGTLTAKEGFALPADAHNDCCDFFHTLRERRGRNFGNGREARRLRDAAVEELALRAMDDQTVSVELTAADFTAAAKRLLEQESKDEKETARIGF